jgi:glycosyltransferase involved in cell wall biosynthesis
VAADIDDLIFDEELIDAGQVAFISRLSDAETAEWKAKARGFRATLTAADFCIGSTTVIQDRLKSLGKHAVCIPNGYSAENVRLSDHWRRRFERIETGNRVCYASGSMTHNEDFESIAEPVSDFLAQRPNWRLTIIGQLNLDSSLHLFDRAQLEFRPRVAHINLAYELARAQINLIPLLRNSFNDAKSPLKWYESALCSTPSIATDNPLYRRLFKEGSGKLACRSDDWLQHLTELADYPDRREGIARKARRQAERLFGPLAVASKWRQLLDSLG